MSTPVETTHDVERQPAMLTLRLRTLCLVLGALVLAVALVAALFLWQFYQSGEKGDAALFRS